MWLIRWFGESSSNEVNYMYDKKGIKMFLVDSYIDFDSMMSIQQTTARLKNDYRIKYLLKCYISRCIYSRQKYNINTHKNSDFLFFYGNVFYRKDHLKTFLDFTEEFENCDIINGEVIDKKKLNIFNIIKYLLLTAVWIIQLLLQGVKITEAFTYLPYAQTCLDVKKLINQLDVKKYKFVVTYYDLQPDDNCLIQYFKSNGITTMTLQHGIFAEKTNKQNVSDTAIEYSKSICDYYLAWNEYSRDEAVKVGVNPNKIQVLGIPKYACMKQINSQYYSDNNIFGVVLNNNDFELHNQMLVKMASELSEKTKMKYILRYHPTMKGDEYNHLTNDFYIGNSDKNTSITEYAQTIEFTLISSSSVFVDLLFIKHPVYRLVVTKEDTYSTVKYNSFNNVDELVLQLHSNSSHNDRIDLFRYLCTSYNAIDNYKKFFVKMEESIK